MKKILFLLLSAAVAFSVAAGVNTKSYRVIPPNSQDTQLVAKGMKNDVKEKRHAKDKRMMRQPMKQAVNKPRANQPEGELVTYTRSGNAVYNHGGTYIAAQQSGEMDIVYDPDGTTVYLKNIIFKSDSLFGDYWVQGTLNSDGTAISVPMGQSIYKFSTYNVYVKLAWGTSTYRVHNGEQFFNFTVDESANQAIYLIEGNTITLQNSYTVGNSVNSVFNGTGLGCVLSSSNETFGGFLEWNTVLTGPPSKPTVIYEIPENCNVYTYHRNSAAIYQYWNYLNFDSTDGNFNVAFDMSGNGDVYIQNPAWYHDDQRSWVKGSYDWMTGIISIPTGQYLRWVDSHEYGIVLGWGSTQAYSEVGNDGEVVYYANASIDESTTEIQLQIDGDYIYLLDTEGNIDDDLPDNLFATGMITYWDDDLSWTSIEFCNRDEYGYAEPWGIKLYMGSAVPANPIVTQWYDYGDESGFSRLFYILPDTDVDGKYINPDNLSYSIYLDDDQLFTFDAATYSYDISEDMDEIPYSLLNGGYDFHPGYTYFYRTNEPGFEPFFNWRIGMQIHYTVDGVKNSSDIVYLEVFENPNAMLGDVNMDNSVTIADVTALIDYLLNQDSTGISLSNADINQDENVTIADVTALIDMLLSGN